MNSKCHSLKHNPHHKIKAKSLDYDLKALIFVFADIFKLEWIGSHYKHENSL